MFDLFANNNGSEILYLFVRFLVRPERSTGWAPMQSVTACAVQAHFSIFDFSGNILDSIEIIFKN